MMAGGADNLRFGFLDVVLVGRTVTEVPAGRAPGLSSFTTPDFVTRPAYVIAELKYNNEHFPRRYLTAADAKISLASVTPISGRIRT